MATSTIQSLPELSCSVCGVQLDSIHSLHNHQTCHTTEELSLALLTIKGLEQPQDREGLKDSETVLLKVGLTKYPYFLHEQICPIDGDVASATTAESSKLVGAVTTLNGETVITPIVKHIKRKIIQESGMTDCTLSDSSCSSHSESADKIVNTEKYMRHKITFKLKNKKIKNQISDKTYLSDMREVNKLDYQKDIDETVQYRENAILLCTSDNPRYTRELDQNNSETDTDIELGGVRSMFELNKNIKLENVHCTSSYSRSLANNRVLNVGSVSDNIMSQNIPEKYECNPGTDEGASGRPKSKSTLANATLVDDMEMECTEESNSLDKNMKHSLNRDTEFTSPIKNESNLDSSYSPGIILSPSNSPHPERHIQAIISRIPNIVLPECRLQTSKTYRKQCVQDNFVIPSPVTHYHRCSVRYDYGKAKNGLCQDGNEKPEEESIFHEYFIPTIQLGPVRDQVDVSCSTEVLQFTEKEIQTNTCLVEQGRDLRTKRSTNGEKESENRNNTNKCAVANKKPEEQQSSTTVRRLALFRKVKVKEKDINQEESKKITVLGSDGSAVTKLKASTHCKVVTTTVQSPQAFLRSGIVSNQYHLSSTASNRERLIRMYPRNITERRFFCAPCGKSYKKKSHLERHLRVHTGERPFPCSFCEKRFAVRSILKQHVRIHTGEKPYSCSVCLQRFPQKSGLMTHMMLHTGKPFKCDLCEKSFVSNHKLLQHLRCHDTQSSHPCDLCEMEFFTEGALSEHKKFHAHMKSFVCMMCGANFVQEISLKLHLDQHLDELTHTNVQT